MKNQVFFGEQGLTSTSANNIANRAKESVNADVIALNSISLVNKTVGLLSGGEPKVVGVGVTNLSSYKEKLVNIAHKHELIAWLREAIKAKEELNSDIDDMSLTDYLSILGKELEPEPRNPEHPNMAEDPTTTDIIDNLPISERQRMLSLGAIAAVCAEFVGPRGSMNKARKELANALVSPNSVSGEGVNTIVTSFSPSVDPADADTFFFGIEKMWTNSNSELNGIKRKIEDAIKDAHLENERKYHEELKEYNSAMAKYNEEYHAWKDYRNNLIDELQAYKDTERERIKNLKIIIPNALKHVYEEVKALAK